MFGRPRVTRRWRERRQRHVETRVAWIEVVLAVGRFEEAADRPLRLGKFMTRPHDADGLRETFRCVSLFETRFGQPGSRFLGACTAPSGYELTHRRC